jgi:protein involved in polysaccharide export with SLBB domain
MGPQIAQSTGQVAGSTMAAFTPGIGVSSEARMLPNELLTQSSRVIVNLEKGMAGNERDNIVLMNGDSLIIPVRMETASVIGAVMNPVTLHIRGHQKLKNIIRLAGGYAEDANKDSVVVSRANGALLPADDIDYVEDGDIVYVPTKVLTTEIITTTDKIINAVKFALATAASVLVFLALIH